MLLRGILTSCAFVPALVAAAASAPSPAVDTVLYVLHEAAPASASTEKPGAVFREMRRDLESSVVQIDANAETGESSMLLMLEGFCGLMRERQHRSAVAEQISVTPTQFRVTFPEGPKVEDKPGPPRLVFTDVECSKVRRH
jgi:hypothetical protein